MRLKDIELGWRRIWINALTQLLAQSLQEPIPSWSRARILFLRHDRIGDMILSTGLLRAIADAHPGIAIDVLASPANAPVLENNPAVARTIGFRRGGIAAYPRIIRTLRETGYDAVIDCMVTAPSLTTLLLMWASGARHRIGVAGRGNDSAYTLLVPPLPAATHMTKRLASLAAAFGIDAAKVDPRPELHLSAGERTAAEAEWSGGAPGVRQGKRLLVNLSAGRGLRFWPDERFVAAATQAMAGIDAMNVLVVAAPDEQHRSAAVAEALGARAVATTSVRMAFALVATADAVFTPDTSIAHAASAFDRPAVAMYVHATSEEWGLLSRGGRNVVSPVRDLGALEAAAVAAALRDVLAGAEEAAARDL